MTKVLIIPDVHNRFYEAEGIIMRENPDHTVFLGDYFDNYGDTPEYALQTAVWLKLSMENSNRTHLLGNHDLSYLDRLERCPGWEEWKQYAVNKTGIDLSKLKMFCYVDDWLCTHAGLSRYFYDAYSRDGETVKDFLERYSEDDDLVRRLYDCSPYRGGRDAFGGILWCDYEEFEDIPNQKQIFGHTHDTKPRTNIGENIQHICLDTFLRYYAIYENKEMEIKKVD